jgi:hypothetical protein
MSEVNLEKSKKLQESFSERHPPPSAIKKSWLNAGFFYC